MTDSAEPSTIPSPPLGLPRHLQRPAPTHRKSASGLCAALVVLVLSAGCAQFPAPNAAGDGTLTDGPATTTPPSAALPPPPPAVESPPEVPYVAKPLLPRTRLDPAQDAERSDLWLRVKGGFAMSDLDGDLVRKWEQWYSRDPAYVQRMFERGGRYLFYITEEVERRGLPHELILLPFIESAFNPQAYSRAAASGMWQFMPGTGRDFELRQNLFRDDRRDVLASTRAALDYLQKLNTMFGGDWQLALAAYNWGQGSVMRAQERNRRAGLPTDYLSLRMPQETREYLPKLQAVKNIVLRPDAYALQLPSLENHPFFLTVSIERDIDVDVAARLSGMTLESFQQLNPQMNKPVILAAGTPQVLLPYDNANRFLRELAEHRGPLASWTAWVAPSTLQPSEAARLTGMPESELRAVNRIPPRMLVRRGSTLLVPRAAHALADVDIDTADNAALALSPEPLPARSLRIKVGKRGDTVLAVARRYRLSPSVVALWNGMSVKGQFQAGDTILLQLPRLSGARRGRSTVKVPARPRSAAPASRPKARQAAPR